MNRIIFFILFSLTLSNVAFADIRIEKVKLKECHILPEIIDLDAITFSLESVMSSGREETYKLTGVFDLAYIVKVDYLLLILNDIDRVVDKSNISEEEIKSEQFSKHAFLVVPSNTWDYTVDELLKLNTGGIKEKLNSVKKAISEEATAYIKRSKILTCK